MTERQWGVLIADDEPAARRGVRQLLEPFREFAVLGECRDGREVLGALDDLRPDVVFLDIQMPEIDGFEVIRRQTRERMPAVVFLTAYEEFAIRAFEAEAVDYLLKPVSEARFEMMIQRLSRKLAAAPQPAVPAFVVPSAGGMVVLSIADIEWIETADNYARLWVGERSYLLREAVRDLEERVHSHGFLRAHRQALIRVDRVRALTRARGGSLMAVLACGTTIPSARRRRAAFAAAVRKAVHR
jgi:two-component system LytT family response regulator